MAAKKWTDAKPVLESLANSYHGESGGSNPLWLLAITHRNLNDTNAELATLRKFAQQESAFLALFQRLLEIESTQRDWIAVTNDAERMLAINPLVSLPYRTQASAATALGNNEQAITAYRKLLLLDPADPVDVHFQLARLLHARGDSEEEARRHVLQALEEAPRFRDAQRLLLEIERKSPQPDTRMSTSKN
jgi:tetratricopeptide (TPR) repeat protein